ncbi:unnamed protein product, partial [Laminaria digitata]
MTDFTTLRDLLNTGVDAEPAIGAPERPALDYAGLRGLADATVARLNELGIGRNDRVAIVLPNSAEMAAAFVTIGCGATTAPLNPAYRADEFDFYLDDLNAKALVVEQGSESPAVAVAQKKNIPVVKLVTADGAPAGSFTLEGGGVGTAAANG